MLATVSAHSGIIHEFQFRGTWLLLELYLLLHQSSDWLFYFQRYLTQIYFIVYFHLWRTVLYLRQLQASPAAGHSSSLFRDVYCWVKLLVHFLAAFLPHGSSPPPHGEFSPGRMLPSKQNSEYRDHTLPTHVPHAFLFRTLRALRVRRFFVISYGATRPLTSSSPGKSGRWATLFVHFLIFKTEASASAPSTGAELLFFRVRRLFLLPQVRYIHFQWKKS